MMLAALTVALLTLGADPEPLTPEKVAKIRADKAKAQAAVDKKYGNKKDTELTPDQRRARDKEKKAAALEVIEKAGTDDKTFSRYEATMNRGEMAAEQKEEERLKSVTDEGTAENGEPELIDVDDPQDIGGMTANAAPAKKAKAPEKKKKRPKK